MQAKPAQAKTAKPDPSAEKPKAQRKDGKPDEDDDDSDEDDSDEEGSDEVLILYLIIFCFFPWLMGLSMPPFVCVIFSIDLQEANYYIHTFISN